MRENADKPHPRQGQKRMNTGKMEDKKCLALIPARGGSKRIPRKNLKDFCGKPIISYPISAALQSGIFSEVMVSTDDSKIADFAISKGASVPFRRSPQTSSDYATINEVIEETLINYLSLKTSFDYFCCILPTAAFITPAILSESFSKMIAMSAESLIPVVRYSPPIQRAFMVADGNLKMIWPENFSKRTQDLPPSYHDAGIFYWAGSSYFLRHRKCLGEKTAAYELPESMARDIDDEEDWKIAEALHEACH